MVDSTITKKTSFGVAEGPIRVDEATEAEHPLRTPEEEADILRPNNNSTGIQISRTSHAVARGVRAEDQEGPEAVAEEDDTAEEAATSMATEI